MKLHLLAAALLPLAFRAFALNGPVFASPAFSDSAIYLRTDGHLYCLTSNINTRP